jgi:uncharacterized SAM-binding protein YcdF (DUF218 family)
MESISYSSLIPPNIFILLALTGVLLAWRWRAAGLVLATAAVLCVYLASLPLVGFALMRSAEGLAGVVSGVSPPGPPGAIVVLSAEYSHSERPGGHDQVGPVTLERLATAVRLAHRTGLPILVSGGWLPHADNSLAGMMAEALATDFNMPPRWREDRSRTTYENALYSAEILRRAQIRSALVVTDPWHMARALWSFDAVGYPAVAAPVDSAATLNLSVGSFFPQVPALMESYLALHELIGLAWYELVDRKR